MTEKIPPSDDYLGLNQPSESQNDAPSPTESQRDEKSGDQDMNAAQQPNSHADDASIVIAEVVENDPQDANAVIQAEPVISDQIAENEDINSSVTAANSPPVATFALSPPGNFDRYNLQLKGGAVGGVLLGTLSVAGAFLTGYSAINGVIGFVLSIIGLGSSARRLAVVGVVLSVVGVVLSSMLAVNR